MASGAVFALLAEIQDQYSLPGWSLGVIAAATFVGNVAMQLTFSRFADRGHTRLLLRAGLLCAGLGMIGFALATGRVGIRRRAVADRRRRRALRPGRAARRRVSQSRAHCRGPRAHGGSRRGRLHRRALRWRRCSSRCEGIRAPFIVLLAVLRGVCSCDRPHRRASSRDPRRAAPRFVACCAGAACTRH